MEDFPRILVAVSQRIDFMPERNEVRDALDQRLVRWLLDAGFFCVPVPNSLVELDESSEIGGKLFQDWLSMVKPGAVVLSGGNDIGEFPKRDMTERSLLVWAQAYRIPVLGICRGMQLMGIWAGASLMNVPGHVGTRHILSISNGNIADWPKSVNSYHNFSLASCPENFSVTARAEDDVIEAIEHAALPWEGWMWHPEREEKFAVEDTGRVRRLILGK